MKQPTAWNGFAVEDHLHVQEQIEKRAFALWEAGGCRPRGDLGNWLRAEREILTRFCLAYVRRAPVRSASSSASNVIKTASIFQFNVSSKHPKTWASEPQVLTTV